MPSSLTVPIIGYHRSMLPQKFGIPRQPNLVALPSEIEMQPPFNSPDAFVGMEAFSHLWITWHSHHNRSQSRFKPQVRPPRLGGNAKLGVFATRSTYRPSQLGLSVVKLIAVETTATGVVLHISGADMVDGTPIIDIKPYLAYSDALTDTKSGFAPDKPVVKPVTISNRANVQLKQEVIAAEQKDQNSLSKIKSSDSLQPHDIDIIKQLIAQDPRPAYRQHEIGREFVIRYGQVDVHFEMRASKELVVTAFTKVDKV